MSRALTRRLTPAAADRLIAASLAIWALFDVPWWWRPPGHGGSNLAIVSIIALAALQSAPFLWRRQQPAVVLCLTTAALAVKFAAHLNLWSASAAVLVAGYGLGAYGSRTARLASRFLVAAAIVAAIVTLQATNGDHAVAIACALFATALAAGEITAAHKDLVASQAKQAFDEELANLAREVHDVLAHQLSAIAVQAGAARFAAVNDPEAAVTAIATIEQGAREGLDELNGLVRRMRPSAVGNGSHDVAVRARLGEQLGSTRQDPVHRPTDEQCPQPALRDVPQLITRASHAGLRAELIVDGEARFLADDIELAGYRVVQEGLTNAIRYAPGTKVTVRLCYTSSGIQVEVADNGPAADAAPSDEGDVVKANVPAAATIAGPGNIRLGGGAGLAGLRERVTLLSGQFEAGQFEAVARAQGFVVRAFLPSPS